MSIMIPRWIFQFSLASVALLISLTISGCQKSSPTADSEIDDTTNPTASVDESPTVSDDSTASNSESMTVPVAPQGDPSTSTPHLGVGDPAPPLVIAQWATGEPVAALEDGHVYVVEFWATWCPPCRTSMPHLSQLQEEYGDKVTFIGVTREDAETVDGFLEKEQSEGKTWRDVVKYRLALDEDGVTNAAYMKAAKQTGIPSAFIVGQDGRVEWIGHPMSMDAPLASIVSGDWDRDEAIAEAKKAEALQAMSQTLGLLIQSKKWDEALAMLDSAEAENGKSLMLTQYRMVVLTQAGRDDEIAALEAGVVEQVWDNANALNGIAWSIATGDREKPDLKLAMKAAKRACELDKHENSATLDTLARVYSAQGNLKAAIEWQTKAANLDKGANASIDETLKEYQAALKKDEPAPKDEPATEKTEPTKDAPASEEEKPASESSE